MAQGSVHKLLDISFTIEMLHPLYIGVQVDILVNVQHNVQEINDLLPGLLVQLPYLLAELGLERRRVASRESSLPESILPFLASEDSA